MAFSIPASTAQEVTTVARNRLINDGIFVDRDGTIYSGCGGLAGQTSVGKIQSDGVVSKLPDKFAGSIDLIRVGDQLIVTNYDDNSIKAFDFATGSVTQVAENLDGPSGIELLEDRLYVSNWGAPPGYAGHRISILNASTFEVIKEVTDDRLLRPQGITAVSDNRLVVANTVNGRMFTLHAATGELSDFTTLGLNTVNLAFDGSLIYSANNKAHQVMVIDLNGRFMTLAGNGQPKTEDGPLEEARFLNPLGVALSADNTALYVSQGTDGALRRITLPEARIDLATIFADTNIGRTSAGLQVPAAVKSVDFYELGEATNNTKKVTVEKGFIANDAIPFERWSISFRYGEKVFGFSDATPN